MKKLGVLILVGVLLCSGLAIEVVNESANNEPVTNVAVSELAPVETAETPTTPVAITPTTTADQVMTQATGEVQDPELVVEDQVPEPEQLSCSAGLYTHATEQTVVKMKAIIDYVQTDLKLDTAELEAIKNDLYNNILNVQLVRTRDDYEALVEKSRGLVTEFKQKANSLSGFDKIAAQQYIDKAMTDNAEYLGGIEAERNKACEAVVLKRFDVFIDNAAKVLNEMEEAGTSGQVIANLKYKLDLLIKMRGELQTALDAGDQEKFLAVENAFQDLMGEMRLKGNLVRVIAREAFGREVSRLAIYRGILKQAETRIDKLAQFGVDITGIKQQLQAIKAKLDDAEAALKEARQKWSNKDYSASKDAAQRANELLDEAKQMYADMRLDTGKGVVRAACKNFDTVLATAEKQVQDAETQLTTISDNATAAEVNEPQGDLGRVTDLLKQARKLKETGRLDEACDYIQKAQIVGSKLRGELGDLRRIRQGAVVVSDTQIEQGTPQALQTVAQRPEVLRNFCEKNPKQCKEFLQNHPIVARIVRERAADIIQNAVESGALNASTVGPVRSVVRQEIQQRIRERIQGIKQPSKGGSVQAPASVENTTAAGAAQ